MRGQNLYWYLRRYKLILHGGSVECKTTIANIWSASKTVDWLHGTESFLACCNLLNSSRIFASYDCLTFTTAVIGNRQWILFWTTLTHAPCFCKMHFNFTSNPCLYFSLFYFIFFYGSTAPFRVPRPPHFEASRSHFRHTTLGRTPLDEGPPRRRDLYLTTHNTHKRETSMPPVGFETTIPVSERP
jgi:hypothetical protein